MKSITWLYRPGMESMAALQQQAIREAMQDYGFHVTVQPWMARSPWRHQGTCEWLVWSFVPTQLEVWSARLKASHQMGVLHELPASDIRLPELDHWIVASESLRMHCLDVGIAAEKITVSTAFNPTRSSPASTLRQKLNIEHEAPLIYVGGPMQVPQGNRMAVWALSILQYLHPYVHMILHGSGEATASVDLWAQGIVNGDVISHEPCETCVHELVSQCDAVWLPRETDGVPDALLSGLTAGKPILASSQPSMLEYIKHRHNGILIENNTAPAWASAMHQLLQENALRMDISAQAAKTRIAKSVALPHCLIDHSYQRTISAA